MITWKPNKRTRMKAGIFCIAVLALFSTVSNAAYTNSYNNKTGLRTSNVNDSCQTTDGFIWIGQYEGLTRFDGKTFQHIHTIEVDGEQVSLEQVTNVESDSHNCLYIGTQNDGVILCEDDLYYKLMPGQGLSVQDINVNDDVAYVATSEGAYVYRDHNAAWIEDSREKDINSISGDGTNVYYVDKSGVAYRYDGKKSEVFYNDTNIKTVRVYDNIVWLGSSYGELIRVDAGKTTVYKVMENTPINTIKPQSNCMFIGTDNGLFVLDDEQITAIHDGNTDGTIENIDFDYEENMWLSTPTGLHEHHNYGIENLLAKFENVSVTVNACYYYEGLLYIGTDQGVYILDEEDESLVDNDLTCMLSGIRIRDFSEFNNKLYIATYSSEQYDVIIYDGETIENLTAEEMLNGADDKDALYAHSQIRCFAVSGNKLIIGTNYGLTIVNGDTYQTIQMVKRPLSITAYSDAFYVCTDGDGIHKFDYKLNDLKTIESTEGKIPLRAIRYGNGIIYGCGMGVYYRENDTVHRINVNLAGSVVDFRVVDDSLVIFTSAGFCFVDKATLIDENVTVTKLFNVANGLNSGITANGRLFYDAQTDTYYLNCSDGVYRYNQDDAFQEPDTLKISIERIDVDGETIPLQNKITLAKNANRLSVDVSVLTFLDRSNLKVYYKMNGMDEQFSELDFNNRQTIQYTNLSGGTYTLTIYAVNGRGIQSEPIEITIEKQLHLYERNEVMIAVVAISALCVAAFTRLLMLRRMKAIQKQAEWRKQVSIDSIEAIAKTIDAKDNYTKGHSIRVAKLSVCIGRRLNMSEEELEILYYIGLMHDVGKVGIPDNILTKPGKLTEEEFTIMKKHPAIGHLILQSIKSIPHLEDGVSFHHEKYDGTGYPNGLKGDEIPLIGRIICCADCYDAMATKRCYKEERADDYIIEELERCSGTQFDPKIAQIAIECIRSGEFRRIIQEIDTANGDNTKENQNTL